MYYIIRDYLRKTITDFDHISVERKVLLAQLADYIRARYQSNQPVHLNYICTHNSRRSQFGQLAAALAADYYAIDQVYSYSGGTEATALNTNALQAMLRAGLLISTDEKTPNPRYQIKYGAQDHILCYSKVYNAFDNPQTHFVAIMTCSDADAECPWILGADIRIATAYDDPKKADGLTEQDQTYDARLKQIITETMYAFSLI